MSDSHAEARPPSDANELGDYRPVSPAAVIALALGALSPVALITPWLTPLPLLAVAVAVAAAAGVRRNADSRTGFGVAAVGLAIAAVTAGALATRGVTADSLHSAEAGRVADRFVELLLEGDAIGAHELSIPWSGRRSSADVARLYYEANEEATAKLDEFLETPVVGRLLRSGGGSASLRREVAPTPMKGGRVAAARYYEAAIPDAPSIGVRVDLRRSSPRVAGVVAWRVESAREARPEELAGDAG
ncbi:MAG: hypothetical protein AAF805_11455 [Planctomycetota bacterium]